MQGALVQGGAVLPYVNATGGALTVGNFISIGNMLGLLTDAGMGSAGPNTSLANGATGRVAVEGVAEAPKVSGSGGAVVAGQPAFWDPANSVMTPLSSQANYRAGVFAEAATQAASRCKVKLNVPSLNQGIMQGASIIGPIDASASGDNAFVTLAQDVRIVSWGLRSKDAGAANVKLKVSGGSDITAVAAKGTVNDALVAGSTIVEAQKNQAKGTVIVINLSAAQAVEVWVLVVPK